LKSLKLAPNEWKILNYLKNEEDAGNSVSYMSMSKNLEIKNSELRMHLDRLKTEVYDDIYEGIDSSESYYLTSEGTKMALRLSK